MTKEQFAIFKAKENELYDKYKDSTDPNACDLLDKEWLEFLINFCKQLNERRFYVRRYNYLQ